MANEHVLGEHEVHPYEAEYVLWTASNAWFGVGANLVFAHAPNSLPNHIFSLKLVTFGTVTERSPDRNNIPKNV